jgi:hypothetical protein
MRPTFSKFGLTLALFALAPLSGTRGAEPPSAPTKFRAHIGGFGGGDYVVELRGNALTYTSRAKERGQPARTETVIPTAAKWRDFRAALDQIRVWQWKTQYPTQGTLDGTQWSLEIAYADKSIVTEGSNNFPDAGGQPTGQPVPTKTFERYLAAVKSLLDGRDFE